jgi:hypothetical protein
LEIGGWIVAIVVGIGGLVVGVVGLNKKQATVISPQPLTVELVEALHKQFAGKGDFDKHVEKTDKELSALKEIIRKEIPEMVADVNAAGEKRIRRLHSRIDPLVVGVAQLCARQGIKMPQPSQVEDES